MKPDPERSHPTPEPAELLALKTSLQGIWKQLPPEHQATMALVLLRSVAVGAYGAWLHEALQITQVGETYTPDMAFPVTSISRADLKRVLTEAEIARLSDTDLYQIAQRMEDLYIDEMFWGDLQSVTRDVLASKPLKGSYGA